MTIHFVTLYKETGIVKSVCSFITCFGLIGHPQIYSQIHFFPVALQTLKDLGRLTYRRFLELFRHAVGLPGRVISPSQGLYLHRTTQHRKTRTKIHALSGNRTHDPSNQPAKTHASDRTATVTGIVSFTFQNNKSETVILPTVMYGCELLILGGKYKCLKRRIQT
jgi:hypothetical protein